MLLWQRRRPQSLLRMHSTIRPCRFASRCYKSACLADCYGSCLNLTGARRHHGRALLGSLIMSNTNPLDESHYQMIVDGIMRAENALRQAEMAERAGIDVGDLKAQAQESLDKLRRMRNVYFPGR